MEERGNAPPIPQTVGVIDVVKSKTVHRQYYRSTIVALAYKLDLVAWNTLSSRIAGVCGPQRPTLSTI